MSFGTALLPKRLRLSSLKSDVLCGALPLLLSLGMFVTGEAWGYTLTVTTPNDSGDGSLRAAVNDAAAGDVIAFPPDFAGTIELTNGEIVIAKDLTIRGSGADKLFVSGGGRSRVFQVHSGATVTMSGLTVERGVVSGNGGGIACFNATVSLNACVVRFCSGFSGGGIAVHAESGVAALTVL